MRISKFLLLASMAAFVTVYSPVYSREYMSWLNGNELYADCLGKNIMYCAGYIEGVSDSLSALASTNEQYRLFCEQRGVVTQQLIDIVVAYIRSHPETRQTEAAELVTLALIKAFPCEK